MTGPWHAAVRRALSVDGERHGVPMLLAVSDERPDRPELTSTHSPDGDMVVTRLDECRSEVAPSARDDDLGMVITVLATVAADEDLG